MRRRSRAGGAARLSNKNTGMQRRDIWLKALDQTAADAAQRRGVHHYRAAQGMADRTAGVPRPSGPRISGPLAPHGMVWPREIFCFAVEVSFCSASSLRCFYWALYGLKFGIGFARLNPGCTRWATSSPSNAEGCRRTAGVSAGAGGLCGAGSALGVSVQKRAFVSLAGPSRDGIARHVRPLCGENATLWIGLGQSSALTQRLINLIPLWVLDGGQAIIALDKSQRIRGVGRGRAVCAPLFSQPAVPAGAGGAGTAPLIRTFLKPSHDATLYYECWCWRRW